MRLPRALTIAGSDSGGGAGIQADLKTFERFEVFGMSAVTLITAQNTLGVQRVHPLPTDLVEAQVHSVVTDLGVDAIKTGALGSVEMIRAVSSLLAAQANVPLVVDPVMVSKHGHVLLEDDAIDTLRTELLPLATVLTPNLHEAERLLGRPIDSMAAREEAARELASLGPKAVLLKAGGLRSEIPTDVLVVQDTVLRLEGVLLQPRAAHGTGCTFSAALTARLAHGDSIVEAAATAKAYISRAIAASPALGGGCRPVLHRA